MTNREFNRIDVKRLNKPTVAKIVVERVIDEFPDISYLEQEEFKDRLESYKNGNFDFIGIRAHAEILIPMTTVPKSAIIQKVNSGGLYGIESDSDESYLQEIEKEQIGELREICKKLNVRVPKNVEIEHKD